MGVHMQGIMREEAFAKPSSRGTAGHGVKELRYGCCSWFYMSKCGTTVVSADVVYGEIYVLHSRVYIIIN